MTTLMQSAESNWPEDEAAQTLEQYFNLVADGSVSYAAAWIEKQRIHMHSVFVDVAGLDEAELLCARYDDYLRQHNITFS